MQNSKVWPAFWAAKETMGEKYENFEGGGGGVSYGENMILENKNTSLV